MKISGFEKSSSVCSQSWWLMTAEKQNEKWRRIGVKWRRRRVKRRWRSSRVMKNENNKWLIIIQVYGSRQLNNNLNPNAIIIIINHQRINVVRRGGEKSTKTICGMAW